MPSVDKSTAMEFKTFLIGSPAPDDDAYEAFIDDGHHIASTEYSELDTLWGRYQGGDQVAVLAELEAIINPASSSAGAVTPTKIDKGTAKAFKQFLKSHPDDARYVTFKASGQVPGGHLAAEEVADLNARWARSTFERKDVIAELDIIITSKLPPTKPKRPSNWWIMVGIPFKDTWTAEGRGPNGEDLVFSLQPQGGLQIGVGNRRGIGFKNKAGTKVDILALTSMFGVIHGRYLDPDGNILIQSLRIFADLGTTLTIPLFVIHERASIKLVINPMVGVYVGHMMSNPLESTTTCLDEDCEESIEETTGGGIVVDGERREISQIIASAAFKLTGGFEFQVDNVTFGLTAGFSVTGVGLGNPQDTDDDLPMRNDTVFIQGSVGF